MGFGGFSVGFAVGIPTGTNPTPARFGYLKDWGWDFKSEIKELIGEGQFVEEAVVGLVKVNGKIVFQQVGAMTLAALLGGTAVTGMKIGSRDEGPTVIPTTPFQITVTNGATFFENLGVFLLTAATGLYTPMTRGATATATGVYSVNDTTGVYTFNTADAGKSVIISYNYTAAAAGSTISISQRTSGTTTNFSLCFQNSIKDNFGFRFPKVVIPDLSFAPKQNDWADMTCSFTAMVDTVTRKIVDVYVGQG
jgi:hypothetical protein